MADNVTIPATGSGTATPVIAADDVSSVFYQRVKLDGGGDGLAVPIIAGQQLAAGSLPVVLTAARTAPAAVNDRRHDDQVDRAGSRSPTSRMSGM